MQARVGLRWAAVVGWFLLTAPVARAVTITLAGPSSGAIAAGVGFEPASPGDLLTFTIALDSAVDLNGYDVTIAWDAAEVSFVSALEQSGLGFDVAPLGATPAGERVAAIELQPAAAQSLFQVTFAVLAGAARDGGADLTVFVDALRNGAGLAPSRLVLANPAGAGIDVPEPRALGLLAAACIGLVAFGNRSSSRRSPS